MKNHPTISVIIPVANEAAALPQCLARVAGAPNEIIVVDAESKDETRLLAERSGCLLLSYPQRHRARQMNFGAARARGRILLFLHADTLLPENALGKISDAIDRRRAIGGAFSRRYRSRSLTLAITSRLAALRNRIFGWHLGDQALFVRLDIFQKLGGYRDIPIFEDLDFSRRLGALGKIVTLTPPVYSSARRFAEKGPLPTTWNDLLLTRRYFFGENPNALCLSRADRIEAVHPTPYEHLS
jgi:rSAM/selenodomain-associated transferase 2